MPTVSELSSAAERVGLSVLDVDPGGFGVALAGDTRDDWRPMRVSVTAPDGSCMALVSTDVLLPWHAESVTAVQVAAAILTEYLVIGHFSVDDDGSVHLRHSALHPVEAVFTDEYVGEWLHLMAYQQAHYGDLMESACRGKVPVDRFAEFVATVEAQGTADLD